MDFEGRNFREQLLSDAEYAVLWPGSLPLDYLSMSVEDPLEHFDAAAILSPGSNEREVADEMDVDARIVGRDTHSYASRWSAHDFEYGVGIASDLANYIESKAEDVSEMEDRQVKELIHDGAERVVSSSDRMVPEGKVVYNLEDVGQHVGLPGMEELAVETDSREKFVADALSDALSDRGFETWTVEPGDYSELHYAHVVGER